SATREQGVVCLGLDVLFYDRLIKTWPTRARFELVGRAEQVEVATHTTINAFFVIVPIDAAEGAFRPLLPSHLELFRSQELLPFVVGLDDFVFHIPFPDGAVGRRLRRAVRRGSTRWLGSARAPEGNAQDRRQSQGSYSA